MKRVIHVNQHVIHSNRKNDEREPPITCKTYKSNDYCSEVVINNHTKVVYRPDAPLKCGATVWVETTEEVVCLK